MRSELKEEKYFYWPGWQTLPQAVPLMGSKWGSPRERGSEGWSGATAWSVFPITLVPKCLKAVCTFCQVGTVLFLIDKQNARAGSNREWGRWARQGFPQSSSCPPSASSSTQLKKNGVCVEDLLRRTGYVCPISLKLWTPFFLLSLQD